MDALDISRVRKFFRINPLEFTWSKLSEDSEDFIGELHKIFQIMHKGDIERVELVVYQLKRVAKLWFD